MLLAQNLEQRCPPFTNSSTLLLEKFQSLCPPVWPELFTKTLEVLGVLQKKTPKAGLHERLFLAVPLPLLRGHGSGTSRFCWKSETHRKDSLLRNSSGMMGPGECSLIVARSEKYVPALTQAQVPWNLGWESCCHVLRRLE